MYVVFVCLAFGLSYMPLPGLIHEAGHLIAALVSDMDVVEFTGRMVTVVGQPPDIVLYAGVAASMLVWGSLSLWALSRKQSVIGAAYCYGVLLAAWTRWPMYMIVSSPENDFGQMTLLGRYYFSMVHLGVGALVIVLAMKHVKILQKMVYSCIRETGRASVFKKRPSVDRDTRWRRGAAGNLL
jgi:hypothetical protein